MNATLEMESPVATENTLTVLHGHTSFETAAVQENYPYGRLRTQMKYWVEKTTKGAKKGESRLVTCSLNPKTNRWNKPHAGVYSEFAWLYRDNRNGYFRHWSVGMYNVAKGVATLKVMGLWDQIPESDRHILQKLAEVEVGRTESGKEFVKNVERVRQAAIAHGYDTPELYKLAGFDSRETNWMYEPEFQFALSVVKFLDQGILTLPPVE